MAGRACLGLGGGVRGTISVGGTTNVGAEVGEEPAAGGGERVFSESRDEVTGRVFDIVDVEHEVDVGQKGEGPRQTGNAFVAASVDGEIFRSE